MNIPDLVTMIGNLSQSLLPVQRFLTGGAYLLGILFFITALVKFKEVGESRHSQVKLFAPIMYLTFGAFLLYLPTAITILANSTFGVSNVLTYTNYSPNRLDVYESMGLLIRTAGILWFVRGCVLIAHASEPGTQEGPKGLVFLCAGVLSMNFDSSIAALNSVISNFIAWSLSVKQSQGY
jgi:hypothetical protein